MSGRRLRRILALAIASILAGAGSVRAVTSIWDGGGANTNWNTAANWAGDVVPPTTNDVEFGSGFASGTQIETNGNRTVNSLIINTSTGFSFSGDVFGFDSLTLTSGNLTRTVGLSNAIIDVDLSLGQSGTWLINSGFVQVNRAIREATPGRTLTKTGTGTLIISGAIGYTGGTFINQGRLILSGGASSTNPITIASAATLTVGPGTVSAPVMLQGGTGFFALQNLSADGALNGPVTLLSTIYTDIDNGSMTLNGVISDGAAAAGLNKQGNGLLQLNGDNSYRGPTQITAGTLAIGHDHALGNGLTTISAGATLSLVGNRTVNTTNLALLGNVHVAGASSWISPLTLNQSSTFDLAAPLAITGALAGPGGLIKAGAETLTLSGNVSIGVSATAGTVRFTSSASLPTGFISDGAAFELAGSLQSQPGRSLAIAGAGVNGQGALRAVDGSSVWNGPLLLNSDSTIFVASGSQLLIAGNAADAGGTLHKIGPGTLSFSGPSARSGGTTISAGVLSVSDDAQLGAGALTISAGTLLYGANTTTSRQLVIPTGGRIQVASAATLTMSGSTISGGFLLGPGTFNTQNSTVFDGVIAFAGSNIAATGPTVFNSFINGGNVTINIPLTWTGGANSSSGKLTVNSATLSTTAFSNDGVITINAGATLSNTDNVLSSGGGSRITINSGGTLNVSGNSLDLSGALLVNNGIVNGPTNINYGSLAKGSGIYGTINITDGGRFSPGNSPGAVTTGSTIWNSGGGYLVEIADALNASGHDNWIIDGVLQLNASPEHPFVISLASIDGLSFDNTRDYTWPILHADGGIVGFDPSELFLDATGFKQNLGIGYFSVESTSTDVIVHFSTVPEPAAMALFGLAAVLSCSGRHWRCVFSPKRSIW